MPTTFFAGRPENFLKAHTIASRGLVMQITNAFGAYFFIPLPTSDITFKLIDNKSSLLIPGFLGTPAVTITTSEPLIAE